MTWRPLIVGLEPTPETLAKGPLRGASGRNVAKYFGLEGGVDELLSLCDAINLYPFPGVCKPGKTGKHRAAVRNLQSLFEGRRIVAIGRPVATGFGLLRTVPLTDMPRLPDGPWKEGWALPRRAGKNHGWNRRVVRDRARALWREQIMPASATTMELANGRVLDLQRPDPLAFGETRRGAEIYVASRLARVERFGAQGQRRITVAQHSIHVALGCAAIARSRGYPEPLTDETGRQHPRPWIQDAALLGLTHDKAEAVLGDRVSPLKRVLGREYRACEDRVDRALDEALELPTVVTHDAELREILHQVDGSIVLDAEATAVMRHSDRGARAWQEQGIDDRLTVRLGVVETLRVPIFKASLNPWGEARARDKWLAALDEIRSNEPGLIERLGRIVES